MAAECRLLEKPRHELVTFDLVDVLLPQRPSSLYAEPAGGTGNGFGDGAIGIVANGSRFFGGAGLGAVVVVVGHVRLQQHRPAGRRMLSSTGPAAAAATGSGQRHSTACHRSAH